MSQRPRFTLERELGQGGEGRVVAVRDAARAGAVVALKETHGLSGRALLREFELLATLRHRHLAEVYEYFPRSPLGGGRAAYTQMLVPGVDLYRTLRAEPGLAPMLVSQLLQALAQLHAAGLVHLDLKPDNVLVERGQGSGAAPRARLVDFGIAARIGSRPDIVRGSRSYVAPEILAGEPVAPSADLFALGVGLAEIGLGSPVLARQVAAEPLATRRARLEAAGMAPALAQLTAVLVALDPAERPKSAHEAAHVWGVLRNTSIELVTPAAAAGLVRSGGLVARGAEKARVLAAIAGRRVMGISGPPASGRTALMESALREAQCLGHATEAWPMVSTTASVAGFIEALGRLVPGAEALTLTPANEDVSSPERWAASLDAAAEAAVAELSALAGVGVGAGVGAGGCGRGRGRGCGAWAWARVWACRSCSCAIRSLRRPRCGRSCGCCGARRCHCHSRWWSVRTTIDRPTSCSDRSARTRCAPSSRPGSAQRWLPSRRWSARWRRLQAGSREESRRCSSCSSRGAR